MKRLFSALISQITVTCSKLFGRKRYDFKGVVQIPAKKEAPRKWMGAKEIRGIDGGIKDEWATLYEEVKAFLRNHKTNSEAMSFDPLPLIPARLNAAVSKLDKKWGVTAEDQKRIAEGWQTAGEYKKNSKKNLWPLALVISLLALAIQLILLAKELQLR